MQKALILITILKAILRIWKKSEGSLSVTKVQSLKGEFFYWTAILFLNTLGTALGDFLADNSGLGFAGGAILIGALLLVVILAHYLTKYSPLLYSGSHLYSRVFSAYLR